MAEQNDNATEKPTEKKLSDSHNKGQFAQAPEIQMVFGLVAAYFVLLFTLGDQSRFITEFVASSLAVIAFVAMRSEEMLREVS